MLYYAFCIARRKEGPNHRRLTIDLEDVLFNLNVSICHTKPTPYIMNNSCIEFNFENYKSFKILLKETIYIQKHGKILICLKLVIKLVLQDYGHYKAMMSCPHTGIYIYIYSVYVTSNMSVNSVNCIFSYLNMLKLKGIFTKFFTNEKIFVRKYQHVVVFMQHSHY